MKNSLYPLLACLPLLAGCALYMDEEEMPLSLIDADAHEQVVTRETEEGIRYSYRYQENVVEMDEQYQKYIVATIGDSILCFSESTPTTFLPKPDEPMAILPSERFPKGKGLVAKEVVKANGMFMVTTRPAESQDIFEDFNVDMNSATLPTTVLTSDGEIIQQSNSDPFEAKSRATVVDGVTFEEIQRDTLCFGEFPTKVAGSFSAFDVELKGNVQVIHVIEKGTIKDEGSIFKGNKNVHTIFRVITIIQNAGDDMFSISGKVKYDFPMLNEIQRKLAQKTSKIVEGVAGFVVWLKPEIAISGTLNLNGQIRYVDVYELKWDNDWGSIRSKPIMKEIKNKYGATGVAPAFSGDHIDGDVSFKTNLFLRMGMSALDGVAEDGTFFNLDVNVGFKVRTNKEPVELMDAESHYTSATWGDPRWEPYSHNSRWYKPRPDHHFYFEMVPGFGEYKKYGAGYTMQKAIETASTGMQLSAGVSAGDGFISAEISQSDACIWVKVDFIALVRAITKKSLSLYVAWPIFPTLDTKESYIVCENPFVNGSTDYVRHYRARLVFSDAGLFKDYERLHIVIKRDNQKGTKEHQTIYDLAYCTDKGRIEAKKAYEIKFDVDMKDVMGGTYEIDKDKLYFAPAFDYPLKFYDVFDQMEKNNNRHHSDEDNSKYNYYVERDFFVRNYTPTMYFEDCFQGDYTCDTGVYGESKNRNYRLVAYTRIVADRKISVCGAKVVISNKELSKVNEQAVKNLRSYTYEITPKHGDVTSLNSGRIDMRLDLACGGQTSLEGKYVYLIPFFKYVDSSSPTMFYENAQPIELADDPDIADFYGYDNSNWHDNYYGEFKY